MKILRGDLAHLLYEAARERAHFRFGDRVLRIDEAGDAAAVSFAGGGIDCYDAVIVAEGLGSAAPERVSHGESEPRWMGLTIAYFIIPLTPNDDLMWVWFNATSGRGTSLRPDRHYPTRAMLTL